jgi:hypothetical protein
MQIEKLTPSTNFTLWKMKILNLIAGKELIKILNKTYKVPTTDAERDQVKVLESRTKSLLYAALNEQYLAAIVHCETSNEIWKTLLTLREASTSNVKFNLRKELSNYKYKEGQPLEEYLSGINLRIASLKTVDVTVEDEEIISKIMDELPKQYKPFINNYEKMIRESTCNFGKFTELLIETEQRLKRTNKIPIRNDALVASKKGVTCYNCGKKGHMKNECRSSKKIQERSDHKSSDENRSKEITCFGCGKKGHTKKDCKTKGKQKPTPTEYLGSTSESDNVWIVDSKAPFHLTAKKSFFHTYTALETPIKIYPINETTIEAIGKGTIRCMVNNGEEWEESILHNVHHVPELGKTNLFSEGATIDRGNSVRKFARKIEFYNKAGVKTLRGTRSPGNLWTLKLRAIGKARACSAKAEMLVWHKRLGHTSQEKLERIERENAAEGFQIKKDSKQLDCMDCPTGRMIRLSCKETTDTEGKPGEKLSADLCGPMQIKSIGGAKYFLLIKDRVTSYREVYFLKTKEAKEITEHIQTHFRLSKNQTGSRVKTLRTDNGTEFVNKYMKEMLSRMGIKHETTAPYTSEEKRSVENDNRTIVEMARTMLHAGQLQPELWAEMIKTAVYIHNRVPNGKDIQSPHERKFKRTPRLDHLRIIGSDAFVHIPKIQTTKWDKESWDGKVVGYGESIKFYRIYNPETQRVHICKDVKILETP